MGAPLFRSESMFGKTLRCDEVKHQYVSQESAEFAWQRPAALVNVLDTEVAD
jgi:hypothetical protein